MEYSIAEKIAYVEEYRESGLSQSQFAKTKGIAPTTFSGWLRLERALAFGEIDLNSSLFFKFSSNRNSSLIIFISSTILSFKDWMTFFAIKKINHFWLISYLSVSSNRYVVGADVKKVPLFKASISAKKSTCQFAGTTKWDYFSLK